MNGIHDMSDEEFVPFLHSLGVETYKKSFEWMLNDREFASVLRWLHNNLDHNNALTAREECRFIDIEKKGQLLSPEDLEASILNIQEQYQGICLPGDKEGKEDVEMEIKMMQEQLHVLEKQERVLADLKRQNEQVKEELSLEVSKLNSAYQQYKEDESAAGEECLSLAKEVETITNGVIDVISDALEMYGNCHCDKETAKKFFTFGPFETYRQSQLLFRSHFDLYASKKFMKRQNDTTSDEELRSALVEAKSMEERLSEAMCSYIQSKAELCGEQAKVSLVANYKDVHPSQITSCLMEAQSAVDLLEQEEAILYQQLHGAVKQLVEERTSLAVETTACCALAVRQQVHADLSQLLSACQAALLLDRGVYLALRRELRALEELLQLAAQLRGYVAAEAQAVCCRMDSMNEICAEHDACEMKLQSSDILLESLFHILGVQGNNDPNALVKLYSELENRVKDLQEAVADGYKKKETLSDDFKSSTQSLRATLWDGCTTQPRAWDRAAAALTHALKQHMDTVDKRVVEASNRFTTVKNGDKQCYRKLWQWFLTDPARLLSALKNANCKVFP
ncbi:augmin complex subunit dgt3 [Trichoplusia ni]|uniref:Augmin complex subunit dgt3 n=1 Tax=Trichoplusia ni TaxID=7111 RepID=A0A7E5WGL1_TRINI|nr:augmin complex subunit dgt3 [Trichoplusia ni]